VGNAEIAKRLLEGKTCKNCIERYSCVDFDKQMPCEKWEDLLSRITRAYAQILNDTKRGRPNHIIVGNKSIGLIAEEIDDIS
jgi:hypothetical protein